MRKIVFITADYCRACKPYIRDVVGPLMEKYPENVEVHVGFDAKIDEVDRRKKIVRVPLVVVENGGEEEFRVTAFPDADDLEDILLCESETLTLEDAFL